MDRSEREVLEQVFDLVLEHAYPQGSGSRPVVDFFSPTELAARLGLEIPQQGAAGAGLIEDVGTYLEHSVRTGDPQFLNQLFGGFNPPAFVGEVIAALTNTSMYTYEVAPVATLIEMELIRKMAGIAGYPEGDGTFVTGGSNANLLAMLLARNSASVDGKRQGLAGRGVHTAFVSDQAHYSFDQAANVLGIGTANVRKVATDAEGRLLPDRLEQEIRKSRDAGEHPFFVGATAGTTVLGAFDPIDELAEVAREFGVWLHTDGSWGGPAILSRKHRHLLRGVEQGDSFSWTPHKMMNVPLICSALLVRDKRLLRHHLALSGTDYLFHGDEDSSCDLGKKSLQCGRRVDALKLWLAWRYYGDAGYEARIDRLFSIAERVAREVERDDHLELMAPVQALNVCFRLRAEGVDDLDRYNRDVRDRLLKEGRSMVNYSTVDGQAVFRFVAANPDLTTEDLDTFFRNLREAASTVLSPAASASE